MHWAGIPTAWSVEIDEFRRRVLKSHFPATRVYSDVNYVDIEYDLAEVDVVIGGFPCQDVSDMGAKRGLDGARSGLWFAFLNVIRVLSPRYVIVENVAGLRRRGMGRVIGGLAALGYVGEWDCIPAGVLHAHHERDRAFIVAYRPVNLRAARRDVVSIQRVRNVADSVALAHAETYPSRGGLPAAPWEVRQSGRGAGFVSVALEFPDLVRNPEVIFDVNALAAYRSLCASWWRHEPAVDRVVDGLSEGLDPTSNNDPYANQLVRRLGALGDSVVPQIIAFLGLRIQAHATARTR